MTTPISEEGHDYDFHRDASSSIFDALQRDEGADIVQLELQGLRLVVDADYHQVRKAIIAAFMRRIEQTMEEQSLGVSDAVKRLLSKYKNVFEKTIFDQEKGYKADQVDFLVSLQRDLARRDKGENLLLFTVKELYDLEVLDEDGVNQWWQHEASSADDSMQRVRAQTRQFVDWLAEAEEDGEEDEEDDDEEDDDEEDDDEEDDDEEEDEEDEGEE